MSTETKPAEDFKPVMFFYTGIRANDNNKKVYSYIDMAGKEMIFGTQLLKIGYIGACFTANSNGQTYKSITHVIEKFEWVSQDAIDKARALHNTFKLQLDTKSANEKRGKEFDKYLNNLLDLAAEMNWVERVSFAAYVSDRIKTARK